MIMAKKSKKTREELENQTLEVAHKIWLAGVGAYGRAYDEARQGAKKVAAGTTEIFEDLVERGSKIEGDMKDMVADNEALSDITDRFTKAAETATDFQKDQRERLEARMERMRELLGVQSRENLAADLHTKIDRMEDEMQTMGKKAKFLAAKEAMVLKQRLDRLTNELTAMTEPVKAKARKTASRKAPAKKAKPASGRPAAKKTIHKTSK